jgi:enamine deaminase RidA (YjgF/YER057c/UK114 family)
MTGRSPNGPVVPGGMAAQSSRVFERLSAVLAHAGTDFSQATKQNVYVTDPGEYKSSGLPVSLSAFSCHPPATTDLVVSCLADPEMCIEVELIADLGAPLSATPLLTKFSVEDHGIDYAQGVIVNGGRLIFAAGQVGNRPDGSFDVNDIGKQAEQAYANIEDILRAGGATPANVIRETMWVRDMEGWHAEGAPVRAEFYGTEFPAATLLGVQKLTDPELLVEIEIIAAVP